MSAFGGKADIAQTFEAEDDRSLKNTVEIGCIAYEQHCGKPRGWGGGWNTWNWMPTRLDDTRWKMRTLPIWKVRQAGGARIVVKARKNDG